MKIEEQGIISAPDDIQMISVYNSNAYIQISGIGKFEEIKVINNYNTNVLQILERLPDNKKWAVAEHQIPNNTDAVAAQIIRGDAKAISDGSFKDDLGTSACLLLGTNDTNSCLGLNLVPG